MRWWLPASFTLLVACGSSEQTDQPSVPSERVGFEDAAPTTAWGEVLERIGPEVDLQTAIDAFSIAFRPISGAQVPEGELGFQGSGSGPLRWLLGHWDELTPQQQNEVEGVLEDWGAVPAPEGAIRGVRAAVTSEQDLKALVEDMVVNYETLLGRELQATIKVKAAKTAAEADNALAVALPVDAAGGFSGVSATCTIIFAPAGQALVGADLVALAAHETFHCFEADLGNLTQAYSRPPWIVEGMAEWAGETLAGGSGLSIKTWREWLNLRALAGLFTRAYDAVGFYAHLTDSGIDVWPRVDAALLASDTSSEAAYQVLIEGGAVDLIDSWSAGYYRDFARAPRWDQNGPGITPDRPKVYLQGVGNDSAFPLAVGPYAIAVVDLDLQAEVVTFDSVASGLALLSDHAEARLADLHGRTFCTKEGGCICPEGSPRAGISFENLPKGTSQVAITGHVGGAIFTVVGWSLEKFCREEPCDVGTWSSWAWHIPRIMGGGLDVEMIITKEGAGFIDFRHATPILALVAGGTFERGPEPLPLKVELDGAASFQIERLAGLSRILSARGSMDLTPYIDFGDGWVETGGAFTFAHGLPTPGTTLTCAGDTMLMNGAVEFRRESREAELPPEADSTEGTFATGSEAGAGPPPTLPVVDPCSLLTLEEVQSLFPAATAPQVDDFGGSLLQCTYGSALAVQVFPPTTAEGFTKGIEAYGFTVLKVDGIGDWAVVEVNEPDPQFGIEATAAVAAAGIAKGTVSLVPFEKVFPGTPQYEKLLELLQLALSRL